MSKRIDHTFVYERINAKIAEATYRLKLAVSGNKLTELSHFVKVPESFLLRYQEMRSSNNSIAMGASLFNGSFVYSWLWLHRPSYPFTPVGS